jgi:hypothetical protein
MMSEKVDKRRIVSEEQLERLKVAREKANAVRAKKAALKKAEKEKSKQELDEKYNALVKPKEAPKDEPLETQEPPHKQKPKKVIQIELDSGETSSDSNSESESESDTEYDITPVKQKYKQKYKNKYATKYPKAYDPLDDVLTVARHNIKSKVSDEIKKMAYASLFG